jgi:ubiquinone/menaquinone biosynthesis C-methylase UbiE
MLPTVGLSDRPGRYDVRRHAVMDIETLPTGTRPRNPVPVPVAAPVPVPGYLDEVYWWAYVHPKAVQVFERPWLVNLILWGNFARLRDAALDELGPRIEGRTLQVACVYGDFSVRLADRIAPDGWLDIVDVLPIQLLNLRKKLAAGSRATAHHRDSTALGFADGTYDQVLLFFLLHEQPDHVRRKTLHEALRVTRPGGKVVVVDYHLPRILHPLRYLFRPVLRVLEPFALDLWRNEIVRWLPDGVGVQAVRKHTYYGGLYQKIVVTV